MGGNRQDDKAIRRENPVEPSPPVRPTSKFVTLTVELSNTRMDRGRRLRNRTESYVLGLVHGGDARYFTPSYDLFSLCCYRALLLGSPGAIVRATVLPGRRLLLTEPLPPQCLKGEDTVEERESGPRLALSFMMQTGEGHHPTRRFFGFRASDARGSLEWLHYEPKQVILERATGAPPTFADVADFQRKSQVIAKGGPLTKVQAWSTWFWLLLHQTYFAAKAATGNYELASWNRQDGILFGRPRLMKHGR